MKFMLVEVFLEAAYQSNKRSRAMIRLTTNAVVSVR